MPDLIGHLALPAGQRLPVGAGNDDLSGRSVPAVDLAAYLNLDLGRVAGESDVYGVLHS